MKCDCLECIAKQVGWTSYRSRSEVFVMGLKDRVWHLTVSVCKAAGEYADDRFSVGVAFQKPGDRFDRRRGLALARKRMLEGKTWLSRRALIEQRGRSYFSDGTPSLTLCVYGMVAELGHMIACDRMRPEHPSNDWDVSCLAYPRWFLRGLMTDCVHGPLGPKYQAARHRAALRSYQEMVTLAKKTGMKA